MHVSSIVPKIYTPAPTVARFNQTWSPNSDFYVPEHVKVYRDTLSNTLSAEVVGDVIEVLITQYPTPSSTTLHKQCKDEKPRLSYDNLSTTLNASLRKRSRALGVARWASC